MVFYIKRSIKFTLVGHFRLENGLDLRKRAKKYPANNCRTQYKYIFKGSEKGAYAFSLHEFILAHKYEQTMNKGEIILIFFEVGQTF